MAPLFTPNHVKLVAACYPPSSTILTSPANSQELSRLAYYAANRPAKIHKVGNELEKRVKSEVKKAQAGNLRSRASVLISLSIFQAVAIECRRDVALLSPSLLASVNAVITALPTDLEAAAIVASVFCAWTTYTDGHVIGVDQRATADYKSALRHFANLSQIQAQNGDTEARNRTRLVGLAALTEVVNSEALYNTSNEFQEQVSVILVPLLVIILQTDIDTLTEQATHVKDAAIASVGDFRARPTMERRAASIHIHVDGEAGPSNKDVVTACLRTVSSMLEHSNGWQLGHAMQSAFLGLAKLKGWTHREQCCWLARMACEWTQYQHRYVVPTRLVERLAGVSSAEAPAADIAAATDTLLAMVTAVLTTPAPLINLSTSDIMHNLIALVIGRAGELGVSDDDQRLKDIAACIAALGTHVYYSDQIQDLASELISRLVVVETQGLANAPGSTPRSLAIRTLLAGLLGLMQAAVSPAGPKDTRDSKTLKRSRISPDTWNDTLSLLCDADYAVRADYARVLTFYLSTEMNAPPDSEPVLPTQAKQDAASRAINAMHAYLFVLATAPSLTITYNARSDSLAPPPNTYTNGAISDPPEEAPVSDGVTQNSKPTTHRDRASRRSMSVPANRKSTILQAAIEKFPSRLSNSTQANASDYAHILMVMEAMIVALPIQGVLIGVPMLLALDSAADAGDTVSQQRKSTVKELVARIWMLIGTQWQCADLKRIATDALAQTPGGTRMPRRPSDSVGMRAPPQPIAIASDTSGSYSARGVAVDAEKALAALVCNMHLQQSTGLDEAALQQHLSTKWTADGALKGALAQPLNYQFRKDGSHTPIYKISKITEGLSNHENSSLHSLAKSGKDVGVNDLRDALEGRGPYANGANGKTTSDTTLDHNTVANGETKTVVKRKSMSRKRISSAVEVRDVLNNLGIPAPQTKKTLNGHAPPVPIRNV